MSVFIYERQIPFMEYDGNDQCFRSQHEGKAIHTEDGIRLMIERVIPDMKEFKV